MTRYMAWFATLLLVFSFSCGKKTAPETAASSGPDQVTEMPTETGDEGEMTEMNTPMPGSFPTVYFDFDKATLRADAREMLQQAAEAMKGNADARITIEGHCDARGSNEYNLALGERRARAVKSYLRTLGVTGDRLSTLSYGEERPASMGGDESAWGQNRRAELVANQ